VTGPDTVAGQRTGAGTGVGLGTGVGTAAGLRPVPFLRVFGVEVRKTLDTRSGQLLLAGVLLLSVLGTVWAWIARDEQVAVFDRYQDATSLGTVVVLPVIGALAMTSEWTQRTALSTFTLQPRRDRVLVAKLLAALAVAAVTAVIAVGIAAVGTLGAAALHGIPVDWGRPLTSAVGMVLVVTLNALMGAAIGLLLQQTAAAITLYYAAPVGWAATGHRVFGEAAEWLDVFTAFNHVAYLEFGGHLGPILVALGVWIVVPMTVGGVRWLRRDVPS